MTSDLYITLPNNKYNARGSSVPYAMNRSYYSQQ
jgi:hypothetical protein